MIIKVAVILTGLINDRTYALPHIRNMFKHLEKASNGVLHFDFYCHLWDSEDLYPYDIDENYFRYKMPKENPKNIDYVYNSFPPYTKIRVSSYKDMYPYFLNYNQEIKKNNIKITEMYNFIDKVTKSDFYDKSLTPNYFIKNFDDVVTNFNIFWTLHKHWCIFTHLNSQVYSFNECLKMIKDSNIKYHSILKWRFDLLADYITVGKTLEELLIHRDENTITTARLWLNDPRKKSTSGQLEVSASALNADNVDKIISDTLAEFKINKSEINNINDWGLSMSDTWFIFGPDVFNKLYNNIITEYIKNDASGFGRHGQHRLILQTILNLGVTISHNIDLKYFAAAVRNPEKIPIDLINSDIELYRQTIINDSLSKSKTTLAIIENNPFSEESKYYTISKFRFCRGYY